ncbi:class I SAM-dependent methyltransferase [Mariniluteicoccus flavus]
MAGAGVGHGPSLAYAGLARARTRWPDAAVEWRQGDVMAAELGPFDAVVSNATLHHLPDTGEAFARLGALVRPGGVVAVVGFARNAWWDWPHAGVGQAVLIVLNAVRRKWEHSAPQSWPPSADIWGRGPRCPGKACGVSIPATGARPLPGGVEASG